MESIMHPLGHTEFSWSSGFNGEWTPSSHTLFSWGVDKFKHVYTHLISEMDSKHFDLYICGNHDFMDGERTVTNWVCPWQPTSTAAIHALASFVPLVPGNLLVDAGCGDGRVLIETALAIGCYGIGIDISLECITCANTIADREGLSIRFVCGDFDECPDEATEAKCMYMYLVPAALKRARKLAEKLSRNGVAIVTYEYHYSDWSISKRDVLNDLVMYELL